MNFTRKFHEFHKIAVLEDSREVKPCSRNLVTILIVYFVAMAMAL
jgi:hypothetical protein